ncbi:glycosyl hydrolase family 18 protein [Persicobacter psychrovividus]|uniref:chitinase n=1 Tax=Persicobacter psychrovividus TaxID=387638 RepID=A0ABM7VK25_9BACT|nr:hypothetical protein PEPS_36210 [Persicobacter psychrovividus]
MKFKVIILLLLCFSTVCLKAQNRSLTDQLESIVDRESNIKFIEDSIIRSKLQQRNVDSIRLLIKIDSLREIEGRSAQEAEVAIDTAAFIKRQEAVKQSPFAQESESEVTFDKKQGIGHQSVYKKNHDLKANTAVFGWHPYWMGSAYKSYNYSLMSHIAYFSYELNPITGGYHSIHDWKTTALIDSVQAHGKKALLTVTNFGERNNQKFLNSLPAQKHFIKTAISLLKARNADGLNIDFENIGASDQGAMTNFIIDLATTMRMQRPDYQLTIALPAFDFHNVYNVSALQPHVDLFIIMGYEFHGSNSTVAGPVAPLSSGNIWWEYNLERAVDQYLASGIAAGKLLLSIPYYGAEWETEDLLFPSKTKHFKGYWTYRKIMNKYGRQTCCYDQISDSKYYVFRDQNNTYRQIWFEDSTSLAKKYQWINNKNIGGVGIWALGFDNGYTELWELLAEHFAEQEARTASGIWNKFMRNFRRYAFYSLRVLKNPKTLITNPRPLMGIIGGMFGVSMVGFFFLYRFGYRLKRYKMLAFKGITIILLLIAGLFVLFGLKFLGYQETKYLMLGVLISTILFLIYSYRSVAEKDLP